MAKKPKPKGKAKGRVPQRSAADFRKAMTQGPTEAQYRAFERSQQAQFRPAIQELERQSQIIPARDPRVLELGRQMGAERPTEAIQQEYATRLANLNQLISGTDTTSAAKGVSGLVGALGGALGVEAAPEIAAEAGGVSAGDAVSRAMLSGAAAQFASLEQQTLGERASRLQQMGMSKAEALREARQERLQTRRQLADLRGQRIAATPDPLQRTLAFLQLDQAMNAGGGGYGAGYGGGYGPMAGVGEDGGEGGISAADALSSQARTGVATKEFMRGNRGKRPSRIPYGVTSTPEYTSVAYPSRGAYPFTGTPGGAPKRPTGSIGSRGPKYGRPKPSKKSGQSRRVPPKR